MGEILYALLVFRSPDEVLRAKEVIDKEVKTDYPNLHVEVVRNEAAAKDVIEKRKGKYSLVITHLHIPADSKNPRNESDQCGLRFLQSINEEGGHIYSILVLVDFIHEINLKASELSNCMLLEEGKEFDEHLVECCKSQLDKIINVQRGKNRVEETEMAQHVVDVEIYLDLINRQWRYKFISKGKKVHPWHDSSGPLKIDEFIIEDLFLRSKENLLQENWEREWRYIGLHLYKQIINDACFYKDFCNVSSRVPDEKNIRFRFNIEKTLQPLAVEALAERDHEAKHKPWMLRAPIYRRLQVSGDIMPPLFYGRTPLSDKINCLIIESNISGPIKNVKDKNGRPVFLNEIQSVTDECNFLQEYLKENKLKYNIGEIRRLKPSDAKNDLIFSDYVKKVLESRPWDLVHYAGHSLYHSDNRKSRGYVFFKGDNEDYGEGKDIEIFALWLRGAKTRFIYLSSCESAGADFVFELASKQIPSIVGFRWKIDDQKAFEYSQKFYTHLFEEKSLEYAFWNAQKEMYEKERAERIWAAPMLIMQISD